MTAAAEGAHERWLPVAGWEGWYAVSDLRNVRRYRPGIAPPASTPVLFTEWTATQSPLIRSLSMHPMTALAYLRRPVCWNP